MSGNPRASIIIPSYNGMAHLPVCLASLRAQAGAPSFETILVDNGSTDESVGFVAREFPAVRVVALPRNEVFVGAVNSGIRAARGEIIILLNNDTEAEPNWLAELVGALDGEPQAGMAASKMRLFDRRDTLHNAGDSFGRDGLPVNRGVWETDAGQYDNDRFVFAACGGAAAYRKTVLDRIGLFDDDLIAYCEDVDLGWRAQLAGYRCVYAPRAIVYHKLSATGGGKLASYYVGRNVLWVLAKNLPDSLWRKYRGRIIAAQLRIARDALLAWRGEAARARLRGQWDGLRGLRGMLAKRKAIQAARVVDDGYIDSLLT
ncbi:MAG: glycosyltransferase family 2 protein [Chloroflexi bacterium]|nr:glycosyltransferase family 2 protein [Chloroflexota bacterium]